MNAKMLTDGLVNVVSNLGTSRDKQSHTTYELPVLTDIDLDVMYRATWLARKIVDIPVLDSLRNWRNWQADSAAVSAIETVEKRILLRNRLLEAYTKARLFGGAAIYIGVGDSDIAKPLNVDRLRRNAPLHLNVIAKRNLSAGELETDARVPNYGKPRFYLMPTATGHLQVHPSRLVILQGAPKADVELSGTNDGWGESVLAAMLDTIRQADATAANVAALVFEARVDVMNIPNLMQNLADGGQQYERELLNRLQLAAMAKGINGMLVLDKEETYTQKSTTFGGLTDVVITFLQLVSGAADIPLTRLLGQSPSGMTATGESDIRNYYDRIRANQELMLTPSMEVLDACIVRVATGTNDPSIYHDWNSLWQLSGKEKSDIGKTTADTIKTLNETALIPQDVMSKVAVSMMSEIGVAPGLEADMREAELEEQDAEMLASTSGLNDSTPATLYAYRKVQNAKQILSWASQQGLTDLVAADDLHVTIAYSTTPVDWLSVGNDWSSDADGKLRIAAGGPRQVSEFDGGAVVLEFASSALKWRHESIVEAGATWDHAEYRPHITLSRSAQKVPLASVVPYNGPIVLNPEVFETLQGSE